MNILILNWRDVKNPLSGGAEVMTHELAKAYVRRGHQVLLLTSGFPGSFPEEILDGVRIIRRGTWWTVQLLAFFYYWWRLKQDTDVIIDEVHWYPFFSVVYARKKVVLLVCETARHLFVRLFPYPVAWLGRALEKVYFFLYRCVSVMAISVSTKNALVKEGIPERNITVLSLGLTIPRGLRIYPKEKTPTLVFLGRLHLLKGVEDAIVTLAWVKARFPNCRLWIVGAGDLAYVEKLKKQAEALGVSDSVKFFGFVPEKEKFSLLSRAHLLIVPSFQEGWGLVVGEAASQGTPAMVYDVAGLRDSVKDGATGIASKQNSPAEMARQVILLMSNKKRYARYQKNCLAWAKSLSWEKAAAQSLELMASVVKS